MTTVHIDRPADTTVVFKAMRRLPAGNYETLEEQRVVLSVATDVALTATDSGAYGATPWTWKCCEYRPGLDGVYSYRLVPTTTTTLQYDDLAQVNPEDFTPPVVPDDPSTSPAPAWWDALTALQAEIDTKRTAKSWNGTAYVDVIDTSHYIGPVDPATLGPVANGSVWDQL